MSFRYILGKDSSSIYSQGSGVRTSKPDRESIYLPVYAKRTYSTEFSLGVSTGSRPSSSSFSTHLLPRISSALHAHCTGCAPFSAHHTTYRLHASGRTSCIVHPSPDYYRVKQPLGRKISIAGRNTEGCVLWAQIPVVKLIRDYP